ncbi:hypothetical protein GCM10018793_33780 [Streptomyces sulfonofaciens]|uniref:Secreted protein n=1 Tax=Streptomyces sulfonofaciens TaxID=68272 RepID=A0A919G864_9ACTN|nr:hypothetical protein [Streptomyces sulfonofaciens]GHH79942.1 hypothetical protein GCM10018793_33780 [Streptomyces sulfonofaciens]
MPLVLLLTAAAVTAVGAAAVHAVHGLRRQIAALHAELGERRSTGARPMVPAARTPVDADEIRMAVAEALADEREREMAEARAFWAAQEARDASSDVPPLLGLPGFPGQLDDQGPGRRTDLAGLLGLEPPEPPAGAEDHPGDSPELAAARRRHPSHPDFVPGKPPRSAQAPYPPGGGDHERVLACLEGLAEARTALADVRPGPLGTLDVYVFEDGTTLCMTPGHRETTERLADALIRGDVPVLLGGSGISGAYALTFTCGGETVYILADRVITSH